MNEELSDEQKHVMFEKGTETAFSGALLSEKRSGDYHCANCKAVLFSSETKFESGSGWPSFTEPKNLNHITLATDTSHGMIRTEVVCTNCGVHLGHVFDDGPKDSGGQRFCVNSICLDFKVNDES